MKLSPSAVLLIAALALPAWAQPDSPARPRPNGPPPERGFPHGPQGINGRDWKDGRSSRPPGGFLSLSPEARRAIFQSFDADGDGKLSPEEMEKAREEVRQRETSRRRQLMARFDKDQDGKLDDQERKAMRAAWEEHLKESKDDLKKKFDKNGDGTIDETEKQAAELELRQKWQQRRQEILRRFDKDGDGVLNEEEKAAAKEARGAPRCEGGERPETGPKPQRPAPSP